MEKIRQRIAQLDYILTGTIIRQYGPCGKVGCRCGINKRNWHGPYYIWTRKENGKTITRSLSAAQARFCKRAISNMRKLRNEIEMWRRESIARAIAK